MLSIGSTIHEIEKALKERNLSQVAKEMGVGKAKLSRILNSVGYEYDSSKQKWRYVWLDERADHRNRSFWHIDEYGLKGQQESEGTREMKSNKNITDIIETNEQFTLAETAALKELAQMHIDRATVVSPTPAGAENVYDAVHALEANTTMRKTFVIDEVLVARLDAFCDKRHIKKSDALAVALTDFLMKYDGFN